jgi:hypothetical protein
MGRRRIDLHDELLEICPNCYYQPPESTRLIYPCIVYELQDMPVKHADNLPYSVGHIYQLTVIDRDPESAVREAVAELPRCAFVRSFDADNLHHYVFRIDY